MMRGTGKAYRTHVHHSSTPYPRPWSFPVRRWLIKQPGEQTCCCSLIYKSTHFKDGRRIRPLFLPPHPRRNRNTPKRCRKLHIPRADFPLGNQLSSIPLLHLVSHHVFFHSNSRKRIGLWVERRAAIVGAVENGVGIFRLSVFRIPSHDEVGGRWLTRALQNKLTMFEPALLSLYPISIGYA